MVRAIRYIIFFLNILCIIPFLATCLIPFLSAQQWWFIGLMGMMFPILFIGTILFLILWIFIKPLFSLVNLIVLLIGVQQIIVMFAFNGNHVFNINKKAATIRILTWNVQYMEGVANNGKDRIQHREDILKYLTSQHADIICLQEYSNHNSLDTLQTNEQSILHRTAFNYSYFPSRDSSIKKTFSIGSIIFSRYPIVDSGYIKYPNSKDKLLFVDLVKGVDTFRLYTTHLFSFKLGNKDYEAIKNLKEEQEINVDASKSLYSKLKIGLKGRAVQADVVHNALKQSPYPSIVCGDFNDVPNSFTYFRIKGNMQDAFLKKGFGIGRTFRNISPTLRIDYILADTSFSIQQCQVGDIKISDHFPVIADVSINNK